MTEKRIREVLDLVAAGGLSPDRALARLKLMPFEDLGFARLDHHRGLRRGAPEVIFGDGKSAAQIYAIGRRMLAAGVNLLITRLAPEKALVLKRKLRALDYRPDARIGMIIRERPAIRTHGTLLVLCAGTSDIPVAEEAALCAETFGNPVERLYDVGVAGLHRLTANAELIQSASVLIVAAGMEGALPSVVAGLVDKPVIAVPTSVGYGASFGGIAALLGMLNSCAGGVTVVNSDNGFGAALAATMINRTGLKRGRD
jgi:pyridinium-3,5-biscarboxylic acid mononucleotide synthase